MANRPTPPGPPRGAQPDARLVGGRYELIEKIAEGGNALVYRAWDHETNEWRAIKMWMPEFAKRSTLLNRFQREGSMMRDLLSHPNICRVYDAGTDSDRAWLVMEYAEGGSVISWLERHGPMPPRLATQVAIQLCAGIAAAHQHGVIHRDVKPHNLLVDRDGVCKVTDFGIAQLIQQTRVTMTGTVMGTIGYIAPEQHESAKHADERADVYSIAASIYTLVHGEAATHLFMAEDREYDGIPEPLAQVIRRGAQYRKEARFQSVAEMQAAFEAILDQLEPDPPGTPPLVEPGIGLPALNQAAPHAPAPEEVSLEQSPDLRPVIAYERFDRTPSSIIPRNSLTGQSPGGRRIKHKNRDEIERQYRIRIAALALGALALLAFFSLTVATLYGWMQLKYAHTNAEAAGLELHNQLRTETRLLDLKLQDLPELESLFAQAEADWDTKPPDERLGDATRLLDSIEGRYKDLLNQGREDALRREHEELEESQKRLGRAINTYQSRQNEYEQERRSIWGRLGRLVPF